MPQQSVLILDFGSQYTQLIARRIREAGVYSIIKPFNLDSKEITALHPRAIILSGGPDSLTQDTALFASEIFSLNIPILGICYGMQLIAKHFGGHIGPASSREFGYAKIFIEEQSDLLSGSDNVDGADSQCLDVWMSHADSVMVSPPNFKIIASTSNTKIAGIADETRKIYGLQFHPEVTHTAQGSAILERFLYQIAACQRTWTIKSIYHDLIDKVCGQIGKDKVMLAISGGVDSAVLAGLLRAAIGDQLICVFVDNGLLRQNEADQIMQRFTEDMQIKVVKIDAKQRFLDQLVGVIDPEEKRKIIGHEFIAVFEEYLQTHRENIHWLAQGTIYPDVIESATGDSVAHVIKSHHNVGGLPKKMNLQLIEPFKYLFKDEVRRLGAMMNLPKVLLNRHPFPGPGLAVRILGEVKKSYLDLLRSADHIFIEELKKADIYDQISQAFAVFLPVRTVGVIGDSRQYGYIVCLRAVTTIDFMTANYAPLDHKFIGHVANRIINEVHGIARVSYDISSKPPATIEWE